jgi:flagellar biosynthesis/type III secretory pathway ATPase
VDLREISNESLSPGRLARAKGIRIGMRSSLCLNLDSYHTRLDFADPFVKVGTIRRAVGLIIESLGPPVPVGTVCEIPSLDGTSSVPAEVIGFRDHMILSMPLRSISGVRLGDKIFAMKSTPTIPVAPSMLGRVIDGLGEQPHAPRDQDDHHPRRRGHEDRAHR